jgi:hypothetical protein
MQQVQCICDDHDSAGQRIRGEDQSFAHDPSKIVEALPHSAVYCGMPKALNATFVAKKVFREHGLLPVKAQ